MHWRDQDGVEAAAITALASLDGKRVLDVGCGDGRLTALAARRAAFVYAFDPDADEVEKARASLTSEQVRRVRFAVHDIGALDVSRERFDIALCGWSLWCVPVEGVVHALRKLHGALSPGAKLVDTQPLSPRPSVTSARGRLGSLDMREWAQKIRAVDDHVARVMADGLFELEEERRFIVTDTFDNGPECVATVSDWGGTRLAPTLAAKIRTAVPPLMVDQEVRLRVLVRVA